MAPDDWIVSLLTTSNPAPEIPVDSFPQQILLHLYLQFCMDQIELYYHLIDMSIVLILKLCAFPS